MADIMVIIIASNIYIGVYRLPEVPKCNQSQSDWNKYPSES